MALVVASLTSSAAPQPGHSRPRPLSVFSLAIGQPAHRQVGQQHRTADRPLRLFRVAVVERADLVLHVAQVDDDEVTVQPWRVRQLALGGNQAGLDDRRNRPRPAVDRHRAADHQPGRRRRAGRGITGPGGVEGKDVGAVVLAQPAAAAGVEQHVPFVPAAAFVAILQPAHQREGQALVAAGSPQLQRAVVVEELGADPDALQRVAVAHQRAAAEAADGAGGRRRRELDRRAAVGARRAVGALRGGGHEAEATRASSAARPSWPRTRPRSGCPCPSVRPAFPAWPSPRRASGPPGRQQPRPPRLRRG
jgi:hypothetical protein